MLSAGLEILGLSVCMLGWVGAIVSCALPMWKVTAFIGSNIVVAQTVWEGLWMSCVVQSTGQMQCKIYDSLLALPQDLQAARALTVICSVLAALGLSMGITGAKCTNCLEDPSAKALTLLISGVTFTLSGLALLVPVSWSANGVIRDFYDPLVPQALKRELGASLYLGWGASALLLLGGGLLCCSCPPPRAHQYPARAAYSAPRSSGPSGFGRRDYV